MKGIFKRKQKKKKNIFNNFTDFLKIFLKNIQNFIPKKWLKMLKKKILIIKN